MNPGTFPVCPFCGTEMKRLPTAHVLIEFDRARNAISGGAGLPLVTFDCDGCGFVAGFNLATVIRQGSR